MLRPIVTCLVVFVASAQSSAANYYVDRTGGNDNYTGTSPDETWQNVGKVNRAFAPGDRILFKRGEVWSWSGTTIEVQSSGTASSPIVFGAYGDPADPRPVIIGPGNQGDNYGYSHIIRIRDQHHITLQDLDLRNAKYCIALHGAGHVVIENNDLGLDGWTGVLAGAGSSGVLTSDCAIRDNTFDSGLRRHVGDGRQDGAYEAIQLREGVENCEVYRNRFIDWIHAAVALGGRVASHPVNHNRVYENFVTAPDLNYARAFLINADGDDISAYNEIYNNEVVQTSTRSQIGGNDNLVYYNIFRSMLYSPDNGGYVSQGLTLEPMFSGDGTCHHNKIYNNTFYDILHPGIAIWAYGSNPTPVINNEIKNNILVNCGTHSLAEGHALEIRERPGEQVSDNIFENNILFTSGTERLVNYNGTSLTVSEFMERDGDNGNVITGQMQADPQFADSTMFDFHLRFGSPAIDSGSAVGLEFDFEGNPIDGVPDIGAYEFTDGQIPPAAPQNLRLE